jgi:hypothetical protein
MSAASCNTQLDHQTCRGSSIGRACGSYLIRYSQPQGRGFEPLLRLFLYSYCHSFWPFVLMLENSFLAHLKFSKFVEACQDFRGPTPHGLLAKLRPFSFLFFLPSYISLVMFWIGLPVYVVRVKSCVRSGYCPSYETR